MNVPFSMKAGQREDPLPHFMSVTVERSPPGLRHDGLLVDEGLQDLLVDAELPQHLLAELSAVGGAVLLELRAVAALELRHGDRLAVDLGERLSEGAAVVALFHGTKKRQT